MRTETEIFNTILNAAQNENIRAVLLCGSRAGEETHDIYQDYDVVYIVKSIKPFCNNVEWIKSVFGQPAVMQLPEAMTAPLTDDGKFVYLMLFFDWVRIDLTVQTKYTDSGEPVKVLLDKDGEYSGLTGKPDFFNIDRPDQKLFSDTCNEFWWCLNNVAKGIARDQLVYVHEMFDKYVRDMLNQMVSWYIGCLTDFSVSAGKMGKYYKKYLPESIYGLYCSTFAGSDYDDVWNAVDVACRLFRFAAGTVAEHFGFCVNCDEAENITEYMVWVRKQCADR